MASSRRVILLAVLAGCGGRPSETESTTVSEPQTNTPTASAARPGSETPYTGTEITRHLPADPAGWTERERPATAVAELGATASVAVVSERTDGLSAFVYVVAFRSAGAARRNARSWASAGR